MRIFAMLSGDNLTLMFDGKHYNLTREMLDIDELYDLAVTAKSTEDEDDLEAVREMLNPLSRVEFNGDLEKDDNGNLYFGKGKEPLPEVLTRKLIEFSEKGLDTKPLMNFWSLCQLNPNVEAREGFLNYVDKYGIVITDKGYAVLYKAVTTNDEYKDEDGLAEFVAEEYLKVKRWKKSPSNYNIHEGEDGYFCMGLANNYHQGTEDISFIGNLQELYDNISSISQDSETYFTDKHTRKMKIQLGVPVKMDRKFCDPDINVECSWGLHTGSFKYVAAFANSSDTIFACLVNPADIVALPNYDNSKIRVCEYYPYAIMERADNGIWTEIDSELFEEDYATFEIQELEEKLMQLNAVSHLKVSNNPELSKEINVVTSRLKVLTDGEEISSCD